MKRSNHINDEFIDKIISVAYGDAGFFDKIKVRKAAERDPEVRKLLEEYRETAGALGLMKLEKCPDEVVASARRKTGVDVSRVSFWGRFLGALTYRPVVPLAAAVLVAALFFSIFFIDRPGVDQHYTHAQVLTAERQVKESLAIVGRVFNITEDQLQNQIIKKQVVPPLRQSILIVNDLFKGG
jgi:hypothetical protein